MSLSHEINCPVTLTGAVEKVRNADFGPAK